MTRRSLARTQIVWGVALSALVACAAFSVRAGGSRVSASASQAQVAPPGSGQASQGGSAGQTPARGGVDPTKQTAGQPTGGRGPGPGGFGPGWEWWKDEAVKKELGLRADQATAIDRIYTRRVKDMDPVLQAYEQERATLNKMMADRLVDDTQLDFELTTKLLPLYSKLYASREMMFYRMSKVLDADQFAKLPAVLEHHNGRGRGGVPAPHAHDLLR